MKAFYCIPAGSFGTPAYTAGQSRATELGLTLVMGDPTGLVTVYPSAAVVCSVSTVAPAIFPDDKGQATLSEIQAAEKTATDAEDAQNSAVTSAAQVVATLAKEVAAFKQQTASDIALVTGSSWDGLTATQRDDIMLRILNGFDSVMDGLTALGKISVPTTA